MRVKTTAAADPQEQFIHLVRLAWDLRRRGLGSAIDLPTGAEPALVVSRASRPLKVMALARDGKWFFTWGRGRDQKVGALAEDAPDRVWEAAQ
ncbi:hypothetical protein [Sphaerisporangium rubeum]|uniref:Uncharacterized protein n=1 Tax=Sphaerisporangium rubeum TaxID=321317 RepID=A0A7X0IGS1_9ACTN|nr:hypothetical protein [Sphaerisporangium rubeum]MBB6474653.1 hypothetical protein [Sphaerisporangium rubeum]